MPKLEAVIPALPVRSISAAVAFYRERLGFAASYEEAGFAIVVRDDAEIHLWQAGDESWRSREDIACNPVCSGAESFISGTASCQIAVAGIDELFAELSTTGVLHSRDTVVNDTDYGTREFPAVDGDGNLLTFYTRARPRG